MAPKNNVFFLLLLVCFAYFTQAQGFKDRFSVCVFAERATLLPHHKMMYPLAEEKFNNFSANIYIQPKELSYWRVAYRLPETGVTFLYSEMSSNSQLGSAFAIMPFMKFALNSSQKYQHKIYFGCGIGYLNKTFDRLDNYKNIAIGSHFNAALRIFYSFEKPICKFLNLETGFGITHFSNGAMALPNRGANQMSLSLGLKINNLYKPFAFSQIDTTKFSSSFTQEFYLFSGIKQLYLGDETKYSTFTFGLALTYKYKSLKATILGLDFFYDSSEYTFYKDNNIEKSMTSFIKSGLYIGHQWFFNKMSFALHFGTYLYAKNRVGEAGDFYNRLVLRYQILPKLELNSSIKAHFAKADYMEWGLVYKPFKTIKFKK